MLSKTYGRIQKIYTALLNLKNRFQLSAGLNPLKSQKTEYNFKGVDHV